MNTTLTAPTTDSTISRLVRSRLGASIVGLLAIIVLVIIGPSVMSPGQLFFWTTTIIAVLFATTVNLLFGSAGIPSLGQAAFFGAGAYTVALASMHTWSAPLALLAAIVVAGLISLATALLTWRTTGLAFAMITVAIAQGLYLYSTKADFIGGYNGMPGVVALPLGPFNLLDPVVFWYFTAICVGIGLAVFWQVRRSPFGRTLGSIREDPLRATYLGINVQAYRAAALVIAGCGAGLAGGLSAYANQIVTPGALYWTESATPIIMLLLGGRAYFWGPAIGAVVLSWLLDVISASTTAYLFYVGIILLIVLLILPEGLLSLPGMVQRYRERWRGRRNRKPAPHSEPVDEHD